jgi:serine/threonine-protein kinase HipA
MEDHSAAPGDDLIDMWRRMAFSVAIHNTDDHLRNHGFLWTPAGWRLSPAFDVNPNPEVGEPRSTAIGGETLRGGEIAALRETSAFFGLSEKGATTILAEVFEATENWRDVAGANGISEREMTMFESAFEGLRDEAVGKSSGVIPSSVSASRADRPRSHARGKGSGEP